MIKGRMQNKAMSMEVDLSLINCCRLGKVEDLNHILTFYKLSDYPELSEGYVLICEALKYKKIQVVKLLLQNEAKVNMDRNKISKCDTPLHYAVYMENIEILQILLSKNADVNAKNEDKKTPLHVAIDQQNEEIVKLLLENGADVESTDRHGCTSLHLAAMYGNIKIVQYLLNHEANINSCCKTYTALHFAVENSNFNIVKLLIQNGGIDNVNYTSYYCLLYLAVSKNNHKILQFLLENRHEICEKSIEDAIIFRDNLNEKNAATGFLRLDICSKNITGPEGETIDQIFVKNREVVKPYHKKDNNCKDPINTLLHKAVIMGQKEVIKVLLNYNFDVNARNEFGRTPMYYAYKYYKLEMCKYLLVNGSCINSKVDGNLNLLHMSVENMDEKFVRFLLSQGADLNASTNDGRTSLHIACRKGCERIVNLLLKHNINIHVKDNKGLTSLHEAVKQDNERIVKLLLCKGFFVNVTTTSHSTPLHFAAQYCQKDVVQRLLKHGANVNLKDNNYKTAICYAVEINNISVFRLLLDRNQDVHDKSNKLAFCLAILGNGSEHKNIVEIFLLRGFTIKSEDFSNFFVPEPLYSKYINEYNKSVYVTVFKDLLKRVPSLNGFLEYEVLRSSIEKGFVKIVQCLLKSDANINILLEQSFTLLHIAVKNGQLWMVEELLRQGANLDATDVCGNTLLHVSVLTEFTDTIAFLLKYKINIEARNENGETALHLASNGATYITKLILDAGANINSKSNNEFTALHIASESGNKNMVELLLEHDAHMNIRNRNNETPLDLAIYYQRKEVINVLLEHGALYNTYLNSSFTREIYEILMTNSAKLQVLSMHKVRTDCKQYHYFQYSCNEEVDRMVHCRIGINVSLYDLLTKRDFEVELYMRNKHILHSLDSIELEEAFPIYSSMLKVRIKKAKRRNLLIKLGSNALECMLQIKIPYLVMQKLFSYISNLDLRNLIYALIVYG